MPGHKSNQDASVRKGEYLQASGEGAVLNRSTASAQTGFVQCPFCNKQVKTKQLADHARQFHSREAKKADSKTHQHVSLLDGVPVSKVALAAGEKTYFVDEGGILINPALLAADEPHKSRDEKLGTVSLPKLTEEQEPRKNEAVGNAQISPKNELIPPKTIDDIFREKQEWLKRAIQRDRRCRTVDKARALTKSGPTLPRPDAVACPVCNTVVKVKRLWKHFASAHSRIKLTADEIVHLENGNVDAIRIRQVRHRGKIKYIREPGGRKGRQARDASNLVTCPLCEHRTQYNTLFVHIQSSHPEVNPKIEMSKFNKANRDRGPKNLSNDKDELDELVREYEKYKRRQ